MGYKDKGSRYNVRIVYIFNPFQPQTQKNLKLKSRLYNLRVQMECKLFKYLESKLH